MQKISTRVILVLVLTVGIAHCSIFEAYNSDDVAYFVKNEQDRNRAIMFYDAFQEEGSYQISNNVQKINGVFLNKGEPGRSDDFWVDHLNDRVNLLRVDTLNPYNKQAMDSFHVAKAPFLIVLEDGNIVFEEAIRDGTYNHLRDVLDTSNSGNFNDYDFGTQNYGSGSNSFNSFEDSLQKYGGNSQQFNSQNRGSHPYDLVDKAEDDLQSADQNIKENSKTVESSLKELQDQRKSLLAYKEVEEAKQKAEMAMHQAEEAQRMYEEAQKDLNEHINQLNKEEEERQRTQFAQNSKTNAYQSQNPNSFSPIAQRVYGDSISSYNLGSSRTWNGYRGRY
ncbi:unnamed protein product [Moneuplotes crassus]|uniref:Uncharacterized protein n=1 Tax=Euplotes crassus TaxID=5936 RepID=A0AAD1XKI2_EUPCR|nr:unnamed protein product [Moneuplotes crassus]